MSAIIRAGHGNAHLLIQPFVQPGELLTKARVAPDDQCDATDAPNHSAVVDLMQTLALRDAEIACHPDAVEAAYAKGEVDGRAAAEDAFEDDRTAAFDALTEGISSARDDLRRAFEGFEALAILVAIEAIDKLTCNPEHYRAMLVDAITAQVHNIRDTGILSVTVSRCDFPDTREIAALEHSLGSASETLRVSDDLGQGECRINLELGEIELGLGRQWDVLKAMLAKLATDGGYSA
jgi:flagellar biosynthesis/type III secretory pathway protein FliH